MSREPAANIWFRRGLLVWLAAMALCMGYFARSGLWLMRVAWTDRSFLFAFSELLACTATACLLMWVLVRYGRRLCLPDAAGQYWFENALTGGAAFVLLPLLTVLTAVAFAGILQTAGNGLTYLVYGIPFIASSARTWDSPLGGWLSEVGFDLFLVGLAVYCWSQYLEKYASGETNSDAPAAPVSEAPAATTSASTV